MDKLSIAICEDDNEELSTLMAAIYDCGIPFRYTSFSSGEDFLKAYHKGMFDLIIMDIYMKGMNGVDTVASIRETDEDVMVAFVTSSTDFTLESYRLNAVKYIEKPAQTKAVSQLLELAQLKRLNVPTLQIKTRGESNKIPFAQILYIEQKGHNIYIHLTQGEVLSANLRLDDLTSQMGSMLLVRCHKSYLVNLSYVEALDRELGVFIMCDGTNVHIRRESFKTVKDIYEKYLFSQARGDVNE